MICRNMSVITCHIIRLILLSAVIHIFKNVILLYSFSTVKTVVTISTNCCNNNNDDDDNNNNNNNNKSIRVFCPRTSALWF
jgi:hypothetical protein